MYFILTMMPRVRKLKNLNEVEDSIIENMFSFWSSSDIPSLKVNAFSGWALYNLNKNNLKKAAKYYKIYCTLAMEHNFPSVRSNPNAYYHKMIKFAWKHLRTGGENKLAKDFDRFNIRMNNLAQHVNQAHNDLNDVHISAKKITAHFNKIEQVELDNN